MQPRVTGAAARLRVRRVAVKALASLGCAGGVLVPAPHGPGGGGGVTVVLICRSASGSSDPSPQEGRKGATPTGAQDPVRGGAARCPAAAGAELGGGEPEGSRGALIAGVDSAAAAAGQQLFAPGRLSGTQAGLAPASWKCAPAGRGWGRRGPPGGGQRRVDHPPLGAARGAPDLPGGPAGKPWRGRSAAATRSRPPSRPSRPPRGMWRRAGRGREPGRSHVPFCPGVWGCRGPSPGGARGSAS